MEVGEEGRFYTPTHSAKGGRRYFYYTLLGEAGASPTKAFGACRQRRLRRESSTR